jgi:F0F1-type ATP synthase membrane subunit b/b'
MKVSEAKAAHEAAATHLQTAEQKLRKAQEHYDYCKDEFDRTGINLTWAHQVEAHEEAAEPVKEPMPTPQELANHAEALHRMRMAF